MSPLPPTCSLEIYMHLAFQIKLIHFFFLQGKITVKNTVGGIVDSSHAFKGMGSVKLLEKYLHYRILTNIRENGFFCKCDMSSMIIVLLQII